MSVTEDQFVDGAIYAGRMGQTGREIYRAHRTARVDNLKAWVVSRGGIGITLEGALSEVVTDSFPVAVFNTPTRGLAPVTRDDVVRSDVDTGAVQDVVSWGFFSDMYSPHEEAPKVEKETKDADVLASALNKLVSGEELTEDEAGAIVGKINLNSNGNYSGYKGETK